MGLRLGWPAGTTCNGQLRPTPPGVPTQTITETSTCLSNHVILVNGEADPLQIEAAAQSAEHCGGGGALAAVLRQGLQEGVALAGCGRVGSRGVGLVAVVLVAAPAAVTTVRAKVAAAADHG